MPEGKSFIVRVCVLTHCVVSTPGTRAATSLIPHTHPNSDSHGVGGGGGEAVGNCKREQIYRLC